MVFKKKHLSLDYVSAESILACTNIFQEALLYNEP